MIYTSAFSVLSSFSFLLQVFARLFMHYHTRVCDSVVSEYFPSAPPTRQMLSDLNGALLNTDNILDYPRLQPETFINIGGMQITKERKPLPKVRED